MSRTFFCLCLHLLFLVSLVFPLFPLIVFLFCYKSQISQTRVESFPGLGAGCNSSNKGNTNTHGQDEVVIE